MIACGDVYALKSSLGQSDWYRSVFDISTASDRRFWSATTPTVRGV